MKIQCLMGEEGKKSAKKCQVLFEIPFFPQTHFAAFTNLIRHSDLVLMHFYFQLASKQNHLKDSKKEKNFTHTHEI
jgi:hypothetical protein